MLKWSFIVIYSWHHPSHTTCLTKTNVWSSVGNGCFKYFCNIKYKIRFYYFLERLLFQSTRKCRTLTTWGDYIKCSPVFFVYRKKSIVLSFFIQVGTNKTTNYLCYSSSKRKLHDGCFEKIWMYNYVKYFKRYDFMKNIKA